MIFVKATETCRLVAMYDTTYLIYVLLLDPTKIKRKYRKLTRNYILPLTGLVTRPVTALCVFNSFH